MNVGKKDDKMGYGLKRKKALIHDTSNDRIANENRWMSH